MGRSDTDGDENLNLELVEEGVFRGSTQVPMLRTADQLFSARESWAFRKKTGCRLERCRSKRDFTGWDPDTAARAVRYRPGIHHGGFNRPYLI